MSQIIKKIIDGNPFNPCHPWPNNKNMSTDKPKKVLLFKDK